MKVSELIEKLQTIAAASERDVEVTVWLPLTGEWADVVAVWLTTDDIEIEIGRITP